MSDPPDCYWDGSCEEFEREEHDKPYGTLVVETCTDCGESCPVSIIEQ